MIFTIKGELMDLNTYINKQRYNRFAGAAVKKKETERVALECMVQKLKPIKVPVFITYYWFCKNKRKDKDNIAATGHKFIQDGLVTAGILKNDGWEDIVGFEDKFSLDAKNPRIEIEILPYDQNIHSGG